MAFEETRVHTIAGSPTGLHARYWAHPEQAPGSEPFSTEQNILHIVDEPNRDLKGLTDNRASQFVDL